MSGLCSKHQHYEKDCEICNAKHGNGYDLDGNPIKYGIHGGSNSVEELAKWLQKEYSIDIAGAGHFYAANWIGIAREVKIIEIEARLKSYESVGYDEYAQHMIRVLTEQLKALKGE